MSDFKDLAMLRRSHRQFTGEPVSEDDVKAILRAALMSPTGKGVRGWSFVVTDNKDKIRELSGIRDRGSQFVAEAPLVIAVIGDSQKSDMWIEDCSIAAVTIQYQAEDLGLGSCWCHVRDRESTVPGVSAEKRVQEILDIPSESKVLCLIAIGHASDERKPQNEDALKWEQVRYER